MVYLKPNQKKYRTLVLKMRYTKIFIIIIFCLFGITAESQTIDSLKSLLKTNIHDTTRCNVLNALIEQEEDDKIWGVYNEEVKRIAESNLRSLNKGSSLYNFYNKCLAGAYNNTGYIAKFHGDIPKALENYHKSLKMFEKLNDKENVANIHNNLGFIYKDQGDFDKALKIFLLNLDLYGKMKNKYAYAFTLNNIGIVYSYKGNLDTALYYYQKCLEAEKEIKNKKLKAYVLNNIGEVYKQQSNSKILPENKTSEQLKESALDHFKKSLILQEEVADRRGIALSMNYIALILLELDKEQEAKAFAERALKVSKESGYTDNIKRSSEVLGGIYAKSGNWKGAYEMQVLFKKMSDSINNESNRRLSIQKEFQYEYDKKVTADSVRTEQERKVFNAQLKQERTRRIALYCGIVLIGLFGAFMFNRFKVTKRQNQLIQKQKTELQRQKEIVEGHQKETLDSIHYAKRIQSALIANSDFVKHHVRENFIYFNPKDIVSGDFYWATLHNDKFYLAVCDSTGHGVPGAFMSLLNIGFLSEAIKEKNIEKPDKIFNYVRERLVSTISDGGQKDGMDGILLCIDKKNNYIEYAAANNEPILIRKKEIIELSKDKMPVGHGEKNNPFSCYSLTMEPGDILYLYTDGFADQFGGPRGKKYKYKQLNELLLSFNETLFEEQKNILESEFKKWKGELEQVDDICIIGLRV